MDPDQNPATYDPDQPDQPSGSSHKKAFIVVAVGIVLVTLSVVIAILLTWPGIEKAVVKKSDPDTRISRAGYTDVAKQIGDPAALTQTLNKEPIVYKPSTIIDACSLLPVRLIKDQNLLLAAGTDPGAMSRHFFDGSSKVGVEQWRTAGTLPQELNDCSYNLTNGRGERSGTLYISVYQPAYAGDLALNRAIDNYLLRSVSLGSVEVYDRTNTPIKDARTYYFLEKDGAFVNLELDLGKKETPGRKKTILNAVAKNLAQAAEKPQGPAVYSYESSTFSGQYVSACDISDAADIKSLFNTGASPSIQERIATATGVITADNKESNYVANECVRRTISENTAASVLTVATHSFENEPAAAAYLRSKHGNTAKEIDEEIQVGEGTIFQPDSGASENTLFFRTGETVITLTTYQTKNNNLNDEQRIQHLTSVAKEILKRMGVEEAPKTDKSKTEKEVEKTTP